VAEVDVVEDYTPEVTVVEITMADRRLSIECKLRMTASVAVFTHLPM